MRNTLTRILIIQPTKIMNTRFLVVIQAAVIISFAATRTNAILCQCQRIGTGVYDETQTRYACNDVDDDPIYFGCILWCPCSSIYAGLSGTS